MVASDQRPYAGHDEGPGPMGPAGAQQDRQQRAQKGDGGR